MKRLSRPKRFGETKGGSMSTDLIELAKRIERESWNRPGADKTWVLNAMSTQLKFAEEVRQAKRVRTR